MKLLLHVIRTNPNHIEEIQIEDVDKFAVDDTVLHIIYNTGNEEKIPLRANDGEHTHEWVGFSVFGTRVGMKVDMNL